MMLLFSVSSTFAILVYGFLLGLKHATEADHLAAVSTIVSGRKSIFSAAMIGGIWGLGHTISLLAAGVFVLLLDFQISERAETILEFCVGIMLVVLGANVLRKLLRGGKLHFHTHEHNGLYHAHPHIHEEADRPHTHHGFSFQSKPLVIGMIHGLAGSAALMLLLIPTIESRAVGLIYILIFGAGSIGGMMLMSLLVSLPFRFTATKFNRVNYFLQSASGAISVGLGLFIVYEKGIG